MRILVIQHDADKGLGLFVRPLAEAAQELDVQFAGHGELELAGHSAVIALPGIANPDDETLAVTATRDVLREALRQELPILGICLGAELLAEAAGAATRPCRPEWGYWEVSLTRRRSRGRAARRPARAVRRLPGAHLRLRAAGARRRARALTGWAAGLPRRRQRLGHPVPPRADARDAGRLDARARAPDRSRGRRSGRDSPPRAASRAGVERARGRDGPAVRRGRRARAVEDQASTKTSNPP